MTKNSWLPTRAQYRIRDNVCSAGQAPWPQRGALLLMACIRNVDNRSLSPRLLPLSLSLSLSLSFGPQGPCGLRPQIEQCQK
ncbi:uncharacterized protein CTRU02_205958 [Colletotrichum truncatum]|uniref:Uncharacterized protein n=1 Tax=Colletotrichum truncatum TaxID=5467 RepID=A0ACC3Z5I1_COLTU|nr:uncharacterized protein CTRU02_04790 [Colletotrichum truncatum]KAF6795227.1 hypothetical protein CTRU02_04790 [Colletotrichum truncatum]